MVLLAQLLGKLCGVIFRSVLTKIAESFIYGSFGILIIVCIIIYNKIKDL